MTDSETPAGPLPRPGRLAWLDALRGVAALAVVADHMIYSMAVFRPFRGVLGQWTALGQYGVFLFFLVSGYIVPASLERKRDVRAFWVSRLFRLYPVYLLASVALLVLAWTGFGSLAGAGRHPVAATLGHLLMMSGVLDSANAPYTVWTLSYEMVFYLLVTALFLARAERRSARLAVCFAAATACLGGVLPTAALTGALGHRATAATADALILGGLAIVLLARTHRGKLGGALLAAVTALTLVAVNGYPSTMPWQALTILALMFTGTLLYRAEHAQVSRWRAVVAVSLVFLLILASLGWEGHHAGHAALLAQLMDQRKWLTSLGGAGLTFLAALALRRRRVPAALSGLGLISYSLYLLHPLLLGMYRQVAWPWAGQPVPARAAVAAGVLAVLVAVSALCYRYIELPAQARGKRVAARLGQPPARPTPARPAPARPAPAPSPSHHAGEIPYARTSGPASLP